MNYGARVYLRKNIEEVQPWHWFYGAYLLPQVYVPETCELYN